MLAENLNTFVADFGVPVVFGALNTFALLDQPDEDVLRGHVQATMYRITYPATALAGLTNGSALSIGVGVGWTIVGGALVYAGPITPAPSPETFKVLGTPMMIDDGQFLEARLERTS